MTFVPFSYVEVVCSGLLGFKDTALRAMLFTDDTTSSACYGLF